MQGGYSHNSIVCDASSLISLTDSCLLGALSEVKKYLNGDFLIPESVKYECIDYPLRIKSHTLPALRLKQAVNEGILTPIDTKELKGKNKILSVVNNIFYIDGKALKLVHEGEGEMLALAEELGINNILIDERTTRMMVEAPFALKEHLENEFRKKVFINNEYLSEFIEITKNLNIFRSSELVIIAYEKGYFRNYGELEKFAVEASLYALKFAGCGISFEEIREFCDSIK